ncbi:MAG: hypothetical protein RL233_1880 [Bacteroidota bacterium]
MKILSHNVNIWQAGVYYINYQVTDPSGNKSQVVLRPVMVQYPPDCENSFLGKKDLTLSEQVMVYPNPTSGIVKVDFAVNNMNPMSIVVTNLTLDLGKYGQGAYMIHIANQNEVTTKKIIVTK